MGEFRTLVESGNARSVPGAAGALVRGGGWRVSRPSSLLAWNERPVGAQPSSMRLLTALPFALAAVLWQPMAAGGQVCTLPDSVGRALPDSVPSPGPYATIRDQGVPFSEFSLGVGHLRPTDETWKWEWLTEIALPLSAAPGAAPWGWIARGWIIDASTGLIAPLTVSGLLETGYEDATFIVMERADDGWLRIRFAPEGSESDAGTAWVPECALAGENVDLHLEMWRDLFLSDRISPLFFRFDVPHVLRSAPGEDGEGLGVIAGDYHLEPLEVAGDWMRVIVKQLSLIHI